MGALGSSVDLQQSPECSSACSPDGRQVVFQAEVHFSSHRWPWSLAKWIQSRRDEIFATHSGLPPGKPFGLGEVTLFTRRLHAQPPRGWLSSRERQASEAGHRRE